MERFETIEKIPTWALCYIINGDPTGLSDEDIKMVDGFMQKWQVEIVSPLSQDGNASFSHYPAFGLPAEVEECKVIYPKSVIRISLCRTAKRNPLIFPI